ncbi:putative monocarboxylate permease [Myxozyma melibiosi]|uniref:Monocarboxylate permease n=1 Tax=Myxozyma melibiosi TaxID=54550 RepID=A0ABR1F7D1_9ASCO
MEEQKDTEEESNATDLLETTEHVYPEGGLAAWLTVAGAFCCMFCAYGWANAIGVFQDYYKTHQLSHLSESTISWIGSLNIFMMYIFGIAAGRIFDMMGPRYPLMIGSVLQVLGLMMTSICNSYGPILVCQGIIAPIGAAFVYYSAVAAVPTYFHRRRGLAMGIASSGSSVGTTVYPFIIRRLTKQTTFGWTMRTCAFLIGGLLLFGNLTITSNVKPRGTWRMPLSDITRHFKDKNFLILSSSIFMGYWGLLVPFNYMTTYARYRGVDDDMATYLVSILNGTSALTRVVNGFFSDRIGKYNVDTAGLVLAAVITLALWIPARGLVSLIIYAIVYGVASGTFIMVSPACCAQISEVTDIGTRIGLSFGFTSIAALTGIPIAGAIIGDGSRDSQWRGMMIFAGVLLSVGAVIHWLGRVYNVGWKLNRVF